MEVLNNFSTSVAKALEEIDPKWNSYQGLIICGTHSPKEWEEQIEKIKEAREKGLPYLGICFGHQLAFIEWCRNVLHMLDATSEEWGKENFVVKKREEGLNVGLKNGESFWNNFEVNEYLSSKWKKANNFITVQYHPEYQSSKKKPHPILVNFLKYAKEYTMAM